MLAQQFQLVLKLCTKTIILQLHRCSQQQEEQLEATPTSVHHLIARCQLVASARTELRCEFEHLAFYPQQQQQRLQRATAVTGLLHRLP